MRILILVFLLLVTACTPREEVAETSTPVVDIVYNVQKVICEKPSLASIATDQADRPEYPPRYLERLAFVESTYKLTARNPRSSAVGMYQFIDSTWLEMMKRIGKKDDPEELLLLRYNPHWNNVVVKEFTDAHVIRYLRLDVPITSGSLYLAHFLGMGNAARALAHPDFYLKDSLRNFSRIQRANPFIKDDWTGIDLHNWAQGKMDRAQIGLVKETFL